MCFAGIYPASQAIYDGAFAQKTPQNFYTAAFCTKLMFAASKPAQEAFPSVRVTMKPEELSPEIEYSTPSGTLI